MLNCEELIKISQDASIFKILLKDVNIDLGAIICGRTGPKTKFNLLKKK